MIFWTTSIFLLTLLLIQLKEVKSISKRDHYLFALCDLRRDVMYYLRSEYEDISKRDYLALKKILKNIDISIICYSRNHAKIIFNFREFAKLVKETEKLNNRSEKIEIHDNKMVNKFRARLQFYILKSFFAYTPFFFEEVVLRIGIKKFSDLRKKILKFDETYHRLEA